MQTLQNERWQEISQFTWWWILRGMALAHLWASYRSYGSTSLSIGTDLLTLAVLEGVRVLAVRKSSRRGPGHGLFNQD